MSLKKTIYLIDPRGIVNGNDFDVFNRHIFYSNKLYSKHKIELKVLTTGNIRAKDIEVPFGFKVINLGKRNRFSVKFIYRCFKLILKDRKNKYGIVSGDANESLLAALIIKQLILLTGAKLPKIQVQIHADMFNKDWYLENATNYSRYFVGKFLIQFVDQIRMVGISQAEHLSLKMKKSKKKVFVAPVPFTYPLKKLPKAKTRNRTYGFIGRLEKERGTEDLIRFALDWLKESSNYKLIIAGDGAQFKKINNDLAKYIITNQVQMLGNLTSSEIQKFWRKINASIFFAKYESFGRAMWESILNDVPVITLPNSGAQDLHKLNQGRNIYFSHKIDDFSSINISSKLIQNYKKDLITYMDESTNLLLNKWKVLVEN